MQTAQYKNVYGSIFVEFRAKEKTVSESGSCGFHGWVTSTRRQQFRQMVTRVRAVFDVLGSGENAAVYNVCEGRKEKLMIFLQSL